MCSYMQTLVDKERRQYEVSSEMSIEFEVDGPYKVCGARVGAWLGGSWMCRLRALAVVVWCVVVFRRVPGWSDEKGEGEMDSAVPCCACV